MNHTTIEAPARRFSLNFEPAPAFGAGTMPADKEPLFAMLSHLFPLIIWFWKRKESPAVDAHGKEALNFGITVFICLFPVSFLAGFLGTFIATVISLCLSVVSLGMLALMIVGMLNAKAGKLLRYPLNFRLIK